MGFGGNKFTSPEAQAEFTRLISKVVAKERRFIPTAQDGELVGMILEKGWESFCEAPSAVPLSIVREFYANAKAEKNRFSVDRGFTVDYRPAAIRRVLNQPKKPRGVEDWALKTRVDVDLEYILAEICVPGTVWKCKDGTNEPITFPASAMNRCARACNLFLCANIMLSSHSHEVTMDREIVLWGILSEEYIDLGHIIHQNMLKFLRGGMTGAIRHASIVTKLCMAIGVRRSEDEQL